ncbi:MAG: hypothetical protein A3K19_21340 [Lentisphaerae bacterium RIFOXYB12_FULL_65_16]|nr:MAG: hypothetical protein A3K18_34015 [Lentisphaerae bacterium RIFOXYA12_64_32]OGV93677.1 MAG: hypothetical protein A3K19_21340 [Lentisphaerae bacterium RIFOXYB12_FULL_65_16]
MKLKVPRAREDAGAGNVVVNFTSVWPGDAPPGKLGDKSHRGTSGEPRGQSLGASLGDRHIVAGLAKMRQCSACGMGRTNVWHAANGRDADLQHR